MENELVIILPQEVEELAVRISEEKKQEVSTVLNQIFAGTSDWKKQAEQIVVKDINDKMSMQLADVGRKNAKTARLEAEKLFDAKRSEVQVKMQDYKLEDSLWLKAKQTMQLLFKDIENTFEYKAKFAERYEAEQKELRTQQRLLNVQKFDTSIYKIEIENMSEEMFNVFLSGLEKQYNEKIESEKKAEQERLAKIEADRIENERIRVENEKLKAANEAKAKALKEAQEKAAKEKAIADEKAKQAKAKADAEIKAANEAKAKAEKELKAKQELEAKAKKEAEIKAEKERKEKEKALKAPDKEKLLKWIDSMQILGIPLTTSGAKEVMRDISIKYVGFKTWAITQIEKL